MCSTTQPKIAQHFTKALSNYTEEIKINKSSPALKFCKAKACKVEFTVVGAYIWKA